MKKATLVLAVLFVALSWAPVVSYAAGLLFVDDNGNVGIGNTTPDHKLDVSGAMYSRLATTSSSVNWDAGNVQSITLGSNTTFTFSNGEAGGKYDLIVTQDGTGGRTITWPASVEWPEETAPTPTSEAGATDIFSFISDGTDYYGTYSLSYNAAPSYEIETGQPIDQPSASTIAHDQNWLAQRFTTSAAGTVEDVELCINNNNGMSGSAIISIETDSSGAPSGTGVGGTASFNLNTMPNSATMSPFTLSSPASLSASTSYWIVLKASGSMTGSGVLCGRDGSFSNPNAKYGDDSFTTNMLSVQYGATIVVQE